MATHSEQPLLSIVIPAFNARPYLGQGLQELSRQADASIEIILADDGSTDGTGEQARAILAQSSVRHRILSLPHRGVSAARNTGLLEARGLYVLFLDADDRLHTQFLTDFHQEAAGEAVDAFAWRCQVTAQEPACDLPPDPPTVWCDISGGELLQEIILKHNGWYPTGTVAFRRQFLAAHQLVYEPDCACGEDQELTLKALSLAERVRRTDTVYTYIVQRQGSVMRSDNWRRFEVIAALQRLAAHFQNRPEPWAKAVAAEIGGPRLLSNFFLNLKSSYRQAGAPEPRKWLKELYTHYPELPALIEPLLRDCPGLDRRLRWEARLFRLAPHMYLQRVGKKVADKKRSGNQR